MPAELVTLATFDSPVEGNLAKGRLEALGIRAFLADEATAWYLAGALGAIKLQVADEDVEAALAILADFTSREPAEIEAEGQTAPSPADEVESILSSREEFAHRAFRGAVMGLLFWPLQFYVVWLLAKVMDSEDPLDQRHRRYAWGAAVISIPFVVLLLCATWEILQ